MAGALPGPATAAALRGHPTVPPALSEELKTAAAVWVIALGKAAHPMCVGALDALRRLTVDVTGGLAVTNVEQASPRPSIDVVVGDHPLPGPRSRRAAGRLADVAALVGEHDAVIVALSGGTSSLVGAPVDGVSDDDYRALCAGLLGSGLDIVAMNAVRKRFSRWGAGRLAVALAPARVLCLVVSDVIGDDLAAIASGPCVPDPLTASEVRTILSAAGLTLPRGCDDYLAQVERGDAPETPKPDEPAFARISATVIGSGALVIEAPMQKAARLGYSVQGRYEPISGDAATCGRRLASEALAIAAQSGPGRDAPYCCVWRGETTVRLSGDEPPGGRCQELALAAAEVLRDAPHEVTLLAAGTDGRDGPTDAAGACVDGTTWEAIRTAGIDPADALARHASYAALEAVGSLVRTGPTGTNVGDVVVALIGPASSTRSPH